MTASRCSSCIVISVLQFSVDVVLYSAYRRITAIFGNVVAFDDACATSKAMYVDTRSLVPSLLTIHAF